MRLIAGIRKSGQTQWRNMMVEKSQPAREIRRQGLGRGTWLVQALALCAVVLLGCKSSEPDGKPPTVGFASVELHGNTPGQIWRVTADVFRGHGYLVMPGTSGWSFDQQGSKMDNFAYGNWIGDTPIWIRVKAKLRPIGEAAFRLECQVVVVRDRGGATEEEVPAHGFKRAPYQKLLDEVATRLTPPAASPSA
jgi:hypothetical protein